jgi:formyltetrahydrofolate hydrolase
VSSVILGEIPEGLAIKLQTRFLNNHVSFYEHSIGTNAYAKSSKQSVKFLRRICFWADQRHIGGMET